MRNLIQTHLMKRKLWPYTVVSIIYSGFIIGAFSSNGLTYVIPILFWVQLIFWLYVVLEIRYFTVKINNIGIEQKRLFNSKEVLWENISFVYFFRGRYRYNNGRGVHLDFVFNNNQHCHVTLNQYSRKNIRILCQAIVEACPNAYIAERIKEMADGKFPWYILKI